MKTENVSIKEPLNETLPSIEFDVAASWQRVIRRRSFLKSVGIATVVLPVGALVAGNPAFASQIRPKPRVSSSSLNAGDTAILRFLAAAEILETDLWTQYEELGGVNGGNAAYKAALQNLDGDMPQYITDNTDDELSHDQFLNAYLVSRGAPPVNLDAFRTLPGSRATGAKKIGRLTNLMQLNVDLSWYTRYRSMENPDFGDKFKGPFQITDQAAIPIDDLETPPNMPQPVPPTTAQQSRMQAIANTAGFHFATIEQGGSSLYTCMATKASDLEVLKIVVSIGGVEVNHFAIWHDKAGNAVSQPLAGVVDPVTGLKFPDLNAPPTELTQTNKIMPEPCDLISESLPDCSIIRPSSVENAGAVAAATALTNMNLFAGQTDDFFDALMDLATAADAAQRSM